MTQLTMAQMLARTLSSLVDEHESVDVLAEIVDQCAELYPAGAVAVMVRDRRGELEPLAATSHSASHLEVLQAQQERGPCVDSLDGATLVCATGNELVERWGDVGQAILAAGFATVHAYPMLWRGRAIGGLNVFASEPGPPSDEAAALGHLFADLVTLVVVQGTQVSDDQVSARLHEAITSRSVVEQAKGVLAYQHDVDVATAYDLLLVAARDTDGSLAETARRVVRDAHGGG